MQFPSMMPLQNALPNMANPTGLMRTSSLDTATTSWIPSQAPAYPPTTPQFTPSFANTFVPSGDSPCCIFTFLLIIPITLLMEIVYSG